MIERILGTLTLALTLLVVAIILAALLPTSARAQSAGYQYIYVPHSMTDLMSDINRQQRERQELSVAPQGTGGQQLQAPGDPCNLQRRWAASANDNGWRLSLTFGSGVYVFSFYDTNGRFLTAGHGSYLTKRLTSGGEACGLVLTPAPEDPKQVIEEKLKGAGLLAFLFRTPDVLDIYEQSIYRVDALADGRINLLRFDAKTLMNNNSLKTVGGPLVLRPQ
jgi:hypothetical protein